MSESDGVCVIVEEEVSSLSGVARGRAKGCPSPGAAPGWSPARGHVVADTIVALREPVRARDVDEEFEDDEDDDFDGEDDDDLDDDDVCDVDDLDDFDDDDDDDDLPFADDEEDY